MSHAAYRQGIFAAYQGELIGESLYRELARRATDPCRKAKLDAIADVECLTHGRLRPIADRLNIVPAEAEWRPIVDRRAIELASLTWPVFISNAMRDWPPYITRFEALQRLAPAGDAEPIQFLVDHEVALVKFVRAEMTDMGSDTALQLLEAFVMRSKAFV
jgi:hypothetical protein